MEENSTFDAQLEVLWPELKRRLEAILIRESAKATELDVAGAMVVAGSRLISALNTEFAARETTKQGRKLPKLNPHNQDERY